MAEKQVIRGRVIGPDELEAVRQFVKQYRDQLVHQHQDLGRPLIVGAYLKYLAYLDGQVVACLGWGSAAWKVVSRDSFIGWDQETRKRNLHQKSLPFHLGTLAWLLRPLQTYDYATQGP